ncbi:putative spermidine/putrescine transport system substrate-binding protein [Leucobacter exalbidus]|uniref:Spermidine/putrescine transport system substrate-binding protein n=1 Tax=Leucobacter exalbidus TaxID=662960 RepID=A0A940PLB1_9MICO|nr:extracellular solute-binding protein [Leucobacter exalbidus]MBP1326032.1 putative spermidine/putrescine transport system substrate-binding protein [Leucobacter exalbidus]
MKKTIIPASALLAVGALLVTGCSGGSSPAEPAPEITAPVAGEVPDGILDGYSLTYAGDGGPSQEAQDAAFFTPFAEASGVTFSQDSPQTLAKVESQVKSGNIQWDMVSTTDNVVALNCGTLFEPLDMSKLDISHMPESLQSGTKCGIPSIVYATVLAYNTDTFVDAAPTNWADFFDTDKFPGQRALYSGDGSVDSGTVQAGALAAGWDPKTAFTMDWAQKGIDVIDKAKEDIVFYSTGAQAQQMIESGEAKLAGVWSGRALTAAQNGASVDVAWDQWISLVDNFAIVKGTKNAEQAYYAMNYALGAEQQTKWMEESGYSPVNTEATPEVDALTQSFILTTPEREATGVTVDLDFWSDPATVEQLQDRWSALVAGA